MILSSLTEREKDKKEMMKRHILAAIILLLRRRQRGRRRRLASEYDCHVIYAVGVIRYPGPAVSADADIT